VAAGQEGEAWGWGGGIAFARKVKGDGGRKWPRKCGNGAKFPGAQHFFGPGLSLLGHLFKRHYA